MLFFIYYNVMYMNIKTNSKLIKKGDIFIPIKGINKDGHDYIDDALNNGAKYVIDCNKDFLYTLLLNFSYIFNDITIIGITGTNGKTTSCFIIYELLKSFNIKSAYIGTLGFYIEDKIKDLDNTTPDIITLYEILLYCKKNNVKVVVMEVSSHSIELDRIHGIKFDYVVFTNLTQDHLDFHNSMNEYLNVKKRLFLNNKDSIGISNIDDKYGYLFKTNKTITYGFNSNDYKIVNYKLYLDKLMYKFKYKNRNYKVKLNITGKYNIYNSLIGIIILNNLGYKINKIIRKIKKIKLPDGRMELIKYNKSYVIIDYAHTPDAVYNVLNNVNEYKKSKVYTIIGCGGNRDKSKREKMGKISTDLSDYVIFTNDNPRDEDPKNILFDITNGLKSTNYEIIEDRSFAIKKGISMLKKDDILLILGKGHEKYQIIDGIKYYFSDKDEVLKNKKSL